MATMQTGGAVQIGWTVSKRISYTETLYLSNELGTERTTDSGRAYVYGNPTDALWAASTQTSGGWRMEEAYQEW